MKRALVLGVCMCFVAGAYAGNTQQIDLTYPVPGAMVPPQNPTGIADAQQVQMHVATVGTSLQYAALILDGDGADQLYIKVQQQDSSGTFHTCGFYHLEGSSIPGITGGPAFFTLDSPFSEGDMLFEHDGAGNMKLTLSNLVPSQPDQVYERGGWIPRNGDEVGIAGFAGLAAMDDFGVGGVCDDFNRADGPLGDDWVLKAGGSGQITGGRAFVGIGGRGRYEFVGGCGGPACNYRIKKSRAKKGCESCPAVGDEVSSGAACEVVKDCDKKLKGNMECPDGGNGFCKIKGKRSSWG